MPCTSDKSKKGNQWRFSMKAHIGVDAESGRVRPVVAMAARVSDITQADAPLYRHESTAFSDSGYQGVHRRDEARGPL